MQANEVLYISLLGVPDNCVAMYNISCRKEEFDRTNFKSAFRVLNNEMI